MANKSLFKSIIGRLAPKTDCVNEAGGTAYAFSANHALAQYAATGCLNTTYYASAEDQLETVLTLCETVDPAFIARTAIYCREHGYMKDMPALLCAVLSVKAPGLLIKIFPRIIDNGKMLRNFVQIIRSGVVGRKSLGSVPKRLIRQWLDDRSDDALFRDAVGQSPSMADVIKMVHPKPMNDSREALYGYLIGRKVDEEKLPALVRAFEAFKAGRGAPVPDVPFQMLTSLELTCKHWREIAKNGGWHMTRMNLNTFARHGVFDMKSNLRYGNGLVVEIAKRLRNREAIAKARAFPYQLMAAYMMTGTDVPQIIREALQDAMEIATENVPAIKGKVYVFPDVSGSMQAAATGYRKGTTSAVRCIDVAALVAAAVLRKNRDAEVLPFECSVCPIALNPRDSVMTNAEKLAQIGGGGTNCSAPLVELNRVKARGDLVIYVSDNESWMNARRGHGTETMREWEVFKKRNPHARMVCIDIQPYGNTQAKERSDILNIGGFSDHVFEVISEFAAGRLTADHWQGVIDAIEL